MDRTLGGVSVLVCQPLEEVPAASAHTVMVSGGACSLCPNAILGDTNEYL